MERDVMQKRFITLGIAAVGVVSLSGLAVAAANTISTTPTPERVSHFRVMTSTPSTATTGTGTSTTVDDHGVDNPATHDVGDDRLSTTVTTADDHGGRANSGPSRVNSGPGRSSTTVTSADDHGASRGPGSVSSGRGNSSTTVTTVDDHRHDGAVTTLTTVDDHGVDNPATHDVGDDHGGRGGSGKG
jgi:hypothetical protein